MMAKLSLRKRLGLEIYRKLYREQAREHPLRQLFWECTQRCNISCKHCGSDCKRTASVPDMPAADFLRVVDSIMPHVNPNKVSVIITGGEPLVRGDIESVGLELYRRGFPWGIVTNGLALTPQRFDRLRRSGIHAMTVSLDGLEQNHNWLRGHPESYSSAMKAIRLLAGADDIKWDIVTCVNRRNYNSLSVLRDRLYDAGVRNWRLFTIFPVGRAVAYPEFQLTGDEYRGLMEFIKQTRAEGRIKASYCCEGFLGDYETEVRDRFFGCQAGITVASIMIDGSIAACPSIRSCLNQGNIYKDDFMDVWNNRYQPYRDRSWMRTGPCADCGMFRYCQGNGMHLRDDEGRLLRCNLHDLKS